LKAYSFKELEIIEIPIPESLIAAARRRSRIIEKVAEIDENMNSISG